MDLIELPDIPAMDVSPSVVQGYAERLQTFQEQAPVIISRIHDPATCQAAVEYTRVLDAYIDEVDRTGKLAVHRDVFHDYWDGICRIIRGFREPAKTIKEQFKTAIVDYNTRERLKREAEAKDKAQAEAKAEAERKLNAAIILEGQGNKPAADAILNTPTPIAPPTPEPVKLAEGISIQERWIARVVDPIAFIKMAAERHEYLGAITINEKELGRMATKQKGRVEMAGVELRREDKMLDRGRRSA